MWYFTDLKTLEFSWDLVKEENFQRRKKVTIPLPLETLVNENSHKEGELLVYQ